MNISELPLVGIDTETGGLDANEHELYEVALRYIDLESPVALGAVEMLVKNTKPIPPEASAIHHLTASHLQMANDRTMVGRWLRNLVPVDAIIFAHNAEFDRSFLPELESFRWLCTRRLAMHVWPEAPAHSNQVLRYWLDLEGCLTEAETAQAHRARIDIIVTEAILRVTLDELWGQFTAGGGEQSLEATRLRESAASSGGFDADLLIEYINSPVRVKKWPFGQYYGELIEAAPTSYIDWASTIVRVKNDKDLRYTMSELLRERLMATV